MIDPIKILQRAWHILWNYRALWVFGLIIAIAVGGSFGNGGDNNGMQYQVDANSPPPQNLQEALDFFNQEMQKLFTEGMPELEATGEEVVTFLWLLGTFLVVLILIGILISVLYYVSVPAVIRMVDQYEQTGTKLTVREGFRLGWSRAAWRVFLINLIVNLPGLLFVLALIIGGVVIYLAAVNDNLTFTPVVIISIIGFLFLGIFVVVIASIILSLFRPFFWRAAVLEDIGVRESLRAGVAMVRENWRSAGLMWLVMIGLGLAWLIVFILAILITLPVVLITSVIAAIVAAIPGLVLVGLISLFLNGPLAWIAAGLFVLPLFFLIAFSPWILLGSWQQVFTSAVWTLTYREIKALPTLLLPEADLEPVGD